MRGTSGSSVISGIRESTGGSVISASTFSSAGGRGGGGRSLVLPTTGSSVHAGGMGGARGAGGGEPLSPGTASARDDGEMSIRLVYAYQRRGGAVSSFCFLDRMRESFSVLFLTAQTIMAPQASSLAAFVL